MKKKKSGEVRRKLGEWVTLRPREESVSGSRSWSIKLHVAKSLSKMEAQVCPLGLATSGYR